MHNVTTLPTITTVWLKISRTFTLGRQWGEGGGRSCRRAGGQEGRREEQGEERERGL